MKRILLSLAIAIALTSLFSCSSKESVSIPTTVSVTTVADTTIMVEKQTPVTAPRYSAGCDKPSVRLPQDKFLGMRSEMVPVNISMTRTGEAVVDCPAGTTSSRGWDWSNFWKILAAIAGIALLIWLLWWLFNQIPSRNQTSQTSVTESSDSRNRSELVALTALVTAMGNAGGGTLDHGDVYVEINGIQPPLVHIENIGSNSQYSGNIKVHSGDKNSESFKIIESAPTVEEKK